MCCRRTRRSHQATRSNNHVQIDRFRSGCGRELPRPAITGAVTCLGCGRSSTPTPGQPQTTPTPQVLLARPGDELLAITFDGFEATLDIRTLDPADGGLGDASTRTYADEGQLGEEPEVLIVADRRVLLNANRSLRLVSVPSGDIDSWPGD